LKGEPGPVEQRPVTERKMSVKKREQRHGRGCASGPPDQRSWLSLLPRRL
jgi:hypothetical protein